MQRINTQDGRWAAGNPQTGIPGSMVTSVWLNAIQEEVVNLIEDAGLELDPDDEHQMSKAVQAYIAQSSLLVLPTTPAEQTPAGLIFVEDQESFMRWVNTAYYTGYRSLMCGEPLFSAYPDPRPGTIEAEGDIIDEDDAPSLVAWMKETGKVKPIANWVAGEYFMGDMGGGSYRLPDLRNMFWRATGTDADTANARALGTVQTGKSPDHKHVTPVNDSGSGSSIQSAVGNDWPYGKLSIGVLRAANVDGIFTGNAEDSWLYSGPVAGANGENRPLNTALYPRLIL